LSIAVIHRTTFPTQKNKKTKEPPSGALLGFGFFVAMLVSLLWRYWRAPHLSDMQIFVATALPTATLAMGLGIPDLNMPMYWNFIFLGFVFCPEGQVNDKGAGDGCPPART
jgi:hypothetical protein